MRTAIAAAVGLSLEALLSRTSQAADDNDESESPGNFSTRRQIASYLMVELGIDHVDIAEVFGLTESWVRYAHRKIGNRTGHRDFRSHVNKLMTDAKKRFACIRRPEEIAEHLDE